MMATQFEIPDTAFGMHRWQLDAWGLGRHPEIFAFHVVRFEPGHGSAFDGYVHPTEGVPSSAYVSGWLSGWQAGRKSDDT